MGRSTTIERVERYLRDLDEALAGMPAGERADIVASVREHIEQALSGDDVTDADVDRVLGALGDPMSIAAEASAGGVPGAVPGAGTGRPRGPLTAPWAPGVIVLTTLLSAFVLIFYLPVITLIVGLVMLWVSALWTPGEKVVGTLLLPAPGVVFVVLGVMFWGASAQVCSSSGVAGPGGVQESEVVCTGGGADWGSVVGTGVLVAAIAAGVAAAFVLYRRGRARAVS